MTTAKHTATFVDAAIGIDYPDLRIDVEISGARREIIGLVGPNGAGKTTILRAIAGLQPIDRGQIAINGTIVDDPARDILTSPQQRRVGVVFQDFRLFPHLSALENVAFGLRCHGHGRSAARRLADEWLHRLGLDDHRNHRPATLSAGQSQRVALARALAVQPHVLLLDEPLAAIDSESRFGIRVDLRRYLETFDGVTILVSHQHDEVRALATRVVMLEAGRVAWSGPATRLGATPVPCSPSARETVKEAQHGA